MLADPQSITISGAAKSLPAVDRGSNRSVYKTDDGVFELRVFHTYGKRVRRTYQLRHTKTAADPLTAGINVVAGASLNVSFDVPATAFFSNAELKADMDGLLAYLSASSGAKITSLLGGES